MQQSEHVVYQGKPSRAGSILRNISFQNMKRTARSGTRHYYRGRLHDNLRVIYDYGEKTIKFCRDLKVSYGTRTESLTYHYSKGIVVKEFRETGNLDYSLRTMQYKFFTNEDEYFTQSLVLDQYLPDWEDFIKMKEMLAEFKQDSYDWDNEMYANKCKRWRESAKKWEQKTGRSLTHHWVRKSKEKPSSS